MKTFYYNKYACGICLLRLYSDNAINKTFIPPNISWTIIIKKEVFQAKSFQSHSKIIKKKFRSEVRK